MRSDCSLLGVTSMSASLPVVVLDGANLTPAAVVRVARGRAVAEMSDEARERNRAAERLVRELV
jgi:histidine ammonia-lyase